MQTLHGIDISTLYGLNYLRPVSYTHLLLLTAVSRTTLPALTLPLLIPTGVFAALLGAAAEMCIRDS